jgi:RNA polymerase subunit RPABC4/transcription elongation factor Spt4
VRSSCEDCGKPVTRRYFVCPSCSLTRTAYRDVLGFDVAASWEDIAQELGVTRQRVQQIYESILRKLRKRHGAELRSVLEAMRGDS